MKFSTLAFAATLLAGVAGSALAQGPAYKAPHNAFGQPDLEGVWTNATITPLTRDAKYGARNVLTKAEAEAAEAATRAQVARADAPTPADATVKDLKNADCGADGISGFNCGYNQGWKDPGTAVIDINGEKRASILVEPADGRFPPMTKDAQDRMRARMAKMRAGGWYDGPEARAPGERCLVGFGSSSGPPMLPVMYNNNYQIVQTRDEVTILVEMVHDVRHIRLNAAHGPSSVKLWMGDSVGHWEGETLVVETTNIRPETAFRGASENEKVVERFTRIGPHKILYRFTVEDPATYTRPFSGEMTLNPAKGRVYEYACHEGNYAMTGMLAGARAAEKAGRPYDIGGPGGEGN
ncbi:MAG: hypothetical protein E7812_15690 [Phenylobacterium sp.]|nr:MAG: hypothetical protein E7812_15690 [Phenylobacterium sp.]